MKIKNYIIKNSTKSLLFVIFFLVAFLERTMFDLGPNIELITTVMILSSYYFGSKQSVLLTLGIMIASDLIIGNSNIFIFTWTGFLIPALLAGTLIKRFSRQNSGFRKKIFETFSLTSIGISSNIFFFLWTNFGVWLTSNMYSKNLYGLILSYINGVPFFKNQIVSTVIFIPVGFVLTKIILHYSLNLSSTKKTQTISVLSH